MQSGRWLFGITTPTHAWLKTLHLCNFLFAIPEYISPVQRNIPSPSEATDWINEKDILCSSERAFVSLWLLLFFLSSVRNYFGEKVALYYLWLGWYTYLLIPPAVIGAIVFLYGLAFFNSSPLMWASLRPLCICVMAAHRLCTQPSAVFQKGGVRRRHGHVPALRQEV